MAVFSDLKERISSILPSHDGPTRRLTHLGQGFAPDEEYHEKPPYSNYSISAHGAQMFLVFLAMCCFASVAAFQAQWHVGPSFLSGFAIFVAVTALFLSTWLLAVPFIYWKHDRLKALARPLNEIRVKLILSVAGTTWLLLISFITTISAWTEPGCKDASTDPHASLGDAYQKALSGWCTTKKAGSAFFWMTFTAWLVSLGLALLEWRTNKGLRPKDAPFAPPAETLDDEPFDAREVDDDSDLSRKPTHQTFASQGDDVAESPFRDSAYAPPSMGRYDPPAPTGRPSMDTYGAFSDPAPTGYAAPGVSRTMQYADPYAAIRHNLSAEPQIAAPRPGMPPNPPSYDGYR
ncbi:hypothetical protein CALCODRAFT_453704 [Calocera cornea HHB12733]|uniref:MARVEL domain-containing protein n=1 Tax=Calocera cornea HHB12733 TaxID=1353952 RepID=A0A165FMM3_9BASI|nr:hypothetical protein CALCODRAFT_453704 [Calocera cornea HHB12733]